MRPASRRACLREPFRAKTWVEVADVGVVSWDKYRGWHVLFSRVQWPGAAKPRRIRINRAPLIGRFMGEQVAHQALTEIRERHRNRPLHDILSEYMNTDVEENGVHHRWEHQYLEAKRVDVRHGDLSRKRLRELETLPGRGYLDFWAEERISVGSIDTPAINRWFDWLRANYGHLAPKTIQHVLNEFRGFLRFMRRVGAIQEVPEFPSVRVPRQRRKVPDRASLAKILAAIPDELRGLFLARGLAGMRPNEARQVEVRDYADGVLTLRPEVTKTRVARYLAIAPVAPALDDWILEHRRGAHPWAPLFPNPRGETPWWSASSERRVWTRACDDAGVERVQPNHGGRHAFATHEISEGADPYAVMDWMGHASINTTRTYEHADALSLARRLRPIPRSSQGQNEGDKREAESEG